MLTLSGGMWDLVPQSGTEPELHVLGAQSLSRWTIKEVSKSARRFLFFLAKLQGVQDLSSLTP